MTVHDELAHALADMLVKDGLIDPARITYAELASLLMEFFIGFDLDTHVI